MYIVGKFTVTKTDQHSRPAMVKKSGACVPDTGLPFLFTMCHACGAAKIQSSPAILTIHNCFSTSTQADCTSKNHNGRYSHGQKILE